MSETQAGDERPQDGPAGRQGWRSVWWKRALVFGVLVAALRVAAGLAIPWRGFHYVVENAVDGFVIGAATEAVSIWFRPAPHDPVVRPAARAGCVRGPAVLI